MRVCGIVGELRMSWGAWDGAVGLLEQVEEAGLVGDADTCVWGVFRGTELGTLRCHWRGDLRKPRGEATG